MRFKVCNVLRNRRRRADYRHHSTKNFHYMQHFVGGLAIKLLDDSDIDIFENLSLACGRTMATIFDSLGLEETSLAIKDNSYGNQYIKHLRKSSRYQERPDIRPNPQ